MVSRSSSCHWRTERICRLSMSLSPIDVSAVLVGVCCAGNAVRRRAHVSLSASTVSGSEKTLRFGKGLLPLAYPVELRAPQKIEPVRRLDEVAVIRSLQGPAHGGASRVKALEQGGRVGVGRGTKTDDEVLLVRPGHGSPIVHAVRREEFRRFQMGLPKDVGMALDVSCLSLAVPLQVAAEKPGTGLVVQKGIADELLRAGSPGSLAGKGEAVPPLGLGVAVVGHHPRQFVVGWGQIDAGIKVAPRAVGGHDAQGVALIGVSGFDLDDGSRQLGLTFQQRAGVHPFPCGKIKEKEAAFIQDQKKAAVGHGLKADLSCAFPHGVLKALRLFRPGLGTGIVTIGHIAPRAFFAEAAPHAQHKGRASMGRIGRQRELLELIGDRGGRHRPLPGWLGRRLRGPRGSQQVEFSGKEQEQETEGGQAARPRAVGRSGRRRAGRLVQQKFRIAGQAAAAPLVREGEFLAAAMRAGKRAYRRHVCPPEMSAGPNCRKKTRIRRDYAGYAGKNRAKAGRRLSAIWKMLFLAGLPSPLRASSNVHLHLLFLRK